MTVLRHDERSIEIEGRRWPALIREEDLPVVDHEYRARNAHVIFENGWLLSIGWGSNHYGSNYLCDWATEWTEEPSQVEVAAWNQRMQQERPHGITEGWVVWPEGDTVQPWLDVALLPDLLDLIADLPSDWEGTGRALISCDSEGHYTLQH